ncbi:sigma factor binding protein 1, chloroplastic-like [Durio zibethinus]|uniref:Sigma factor binding protein 1, chloroplastic-like n=1 Tax=Durio zibethinus TaxID=66656 RepID=A0A6P6AHU0_DURZI|nr:sigma factor binding protein 1, chloroplastic-like [Durio zibethinus]
MDVSGVRQMKSNKKHSRRSNSKKDIKVVYISSPMKVKTCASRFRALVQELTGKDSDAAVRFMDNCDSSESSPTVSDATRVVDDRVVGLPLANSNHESVFEPLDDGLMTEGSFLGMFTSNLFNDPSQLDAIGSFGSV